MSAIAIPPEPESITNHEGSALGLTVSLFPPTQDWYICQRDFNLFTVSQRLGMDIREPILEDRLRMQRNVKLLNELVRYGYLAPARAAQCDATIN